MINYSIAEQLNLSMTEIFGKLRVSLALILATICARAENILLKVSQVLMSLFWFIVQSVMLGQIVQARGEGNNSR